MSERALLASCIASRTAYTSVIDHLGKEDVTEQGRLILKHVGEYYDVDPAATSVNEELLVSGVTRALANPKHVTALVPVVRTLCSMEVSAANVVRDFIQVKLDVVGSRLASALAGKASPDTIQELMDAYAQWTDATSVAEEDSKDTVLNGIPISSLVEDNFSDEALIRIYPKALNDRLDGGCLRGHHVVVYARPEMGKTMLLINMIYGFLQQDLRVLYIGNEEPIVDTCMRVVCRLSGLSKFEVIADPKAAEKTAAEKGYNNLFLASLAPGTPRQMDELAQEYSVDVLLVDQLRNIKMKEDNFTQQLEKAARAIRQIAKRRNVLVISVTQAGDSATGKGVLSMGDVDSSNTGIPAQCDVMIGLGATPEDERAGRRVISLAKNKRSGKHEFFPVAVDTGTSKIRSIV